MILAAGLGTRLRPLTDDRPKALVEIRGRTLLEIALARLRSFGICDVIINVHHFAEMVIGYLAGNNNFGMRIVISREEELLDTGGGLKKASLFFLGHPDEPFLVHNVDVLSSIDFGRMVQSHRESQALATLAVQQRDTSRQLLFDEQAQLCGRRSDGKDPELVRPSEQWQALAFCGIHVISPRVLLLMSEEGAFPVVTTYLRLASQGQKIAGFRADGYYWRDVGKPESVREAAADLVRGALGE